MQITVFIGATPTPFCVQDWVLIVQRVAFYKISIQFYGAQPDVNGHELEENDMPTKLV